MKVSMPIEYPQETFTHKDDDGVFRTFLCGTMKRVAAQYGARCPDIMPVTLPIEAGAVEHIRKNMGIEQNRLDRLVSPYLHTPLIGILWPPDNKITTIIDGNHRIVKLHDTGENSIRMYVFRHPFWEKFLLPIPDDKAEQRLTLPSGVIEFENRL